MQKNNKKLAYSKWGSSDLRNVRTEIGKTQAKMAEVLGISARMYRAYGVRNEIFESTIARNTSRDGKLV